MLTFNPEFEERLVDLRIASFLRRELAPRLPELFESAQDAMTDEQLVGAVREARARLRPWQMETERAVLKYCFGSFLLGRPVEAAEPRLVPMFSSAAYHRHKKEDLLDFVVEKLLRERKTSGGGE